VAAVEILVFVGMMTPVYRPVASPPYRSPEQWHGPCFVLDVKAWRRGERVTVRTTLPLPRRVVHPKPVVWHPDLQTGETRQVVTWPPGQPQDWRIEEVPVMRREPLWHARARALRAAGLSIRRIMAELGLVNRAALDRVLAE